MGVEGLQWFIKQNAEEFCTRARLNNYLPSRRGPDGKVRVVVDGNNFAYEVLRQSRAPACFGSEPAVYEHIIHHRFLKYHLKSCDEIIFVMGYSSAPGSDCWTKKRANEHESAMKFFERIRNGESPHSQGVIGNDGHRRYDFLKVSPPWIVHQIMEIVEKDERVQVYQAESDKDFAIMDLAVDLGCPIMSNDSDFLLFAAQERPVIKMGDWRGAADIISDYWYSSEEIKLQYYHLPLVSILCFNRECEISEEELKPFWYALIGKAEFEISKKPNVIPQVVRWIVKTFEEEGKLKEKF